MTKWMCTLMFCKQLYVGHFCCCSWNVKNNYKIVSVYENNGSERLWVAKQLQWWNKFGTNNNIVHNGIAREFLAKALIVVVNVALACKPPICFHLFLSCHHLCITKGCRKDIIWKVETNFFSFCAMWIVEKR